VSYRKATIRPYRETDESVLFSLARSVFGGEPAWDDGRTLATIEADVVFVAEVDGHTAGYVALELTDGAVCIEQLLVAPEHEGEGVGRQLLDYAEGYAISEGAATLQVVVEEDNRRALDFYRRRGFERSTGDLFELVLPRSAKGA
jgi:ribosomal protein S18 acetylase RimI-like enzyme